MPSTTRLTMTTLSSKASSLLNRDNYDALFSIIADMCEREGIEKTETNVDHILEQIKAGIN